MGSAEVYELVKATDFGRTWLKNAKNEGIVEGELKGKLEGKLEIARTMFKEGFTTEKIIMLTQLPVELVQNLNENY